MDDISIDYDFNYDDNYTYENLSTDEITLHKNHTTCFHEPICAILVLVNVIIFVLGVCGNGLVIWIAGFKMKRTVNTTWYLSLAVSDFIFCLSLPLNIYYMATTHWVFGLFMCKFTSFILFLNMFSSILLLVVISVDRCVSVMFPVWAQNHRGLRLASGIVVLAWIISAAFSFPSIVFRDLLTHIGQTRCYNNYKSREHYHELVAFSRFVFGFLLPFLIIISCYSIIIVKLRANQMARSSKPFRVMTALVATFFLCWIPYHTFVLMELNHKNHSGFVQNGLQWGTVMATANSFLNPVLYVFMGNDFRQKFKNSIMSKIENAMGEEGRTISRYLSRSSSVDTRASTHI
ncbi:chemokine-like receptor 1 [Chanos chanos]|uniref:Chemokine-like receptor 1 n=1 Tax=Chanos chanos TaxID=29144 RepID=A0A6J2WSR1_CHACN|nr:chemokine-like receptor 1 [Chanos chanos]